MADYHHHQEPKVDEPCETGTPAAVKIEEPVESSDRGLFGFMGKKPEEKKCEEDVVSHEFGHKLQVSEPEEVKKEEYYQAPEEVKKEEYYKAPEEAAEEDKKHESLLQKLHRSGSSSSSSSDEEEVGEDGLKKKKKKGLKEKIKGKATGDEKKEEEVKCEDTSVPVEKYEEVPTSEHEEKKGFLEKIKDKIPGGKKTEEGHGKKPEEVVAPPPAVEHAATTEAEGKEKKGFLEKIKEKLPGYHSNEEKEKEKELEKEKEKECL